MLPVTSGHRLTLTYNLYVTEHTGSILQPSLPSADPSLLPLFSGAEQMLAQPNFMPNGKLPSDSPSLVLTNPNNSC